MQKKSGLVYYWIQFHEKEPIIFERMDGDDMYSDLKKNNIHRKAYIHDDQRPIEGQVFQDDKFRLPESNDYILVRLYDLIDEDALLFPEENQISMIDYQNSYNSFLGEVGLLDINYTRTLFITQQINKEGFYQFFVKRDGAYFVSCIDDQIPVNPKTKKPLWGLDLKYPWQVLLLKAWLKERESWGGFHDTLPFDFLDAFGYPSYKGYNFRKDIKFCKQQRVKNEERIRNIKELALNTTRANIYAKSVKSEKIRKVGLIPDFVGYQVQFALTEKGENMYKVRSSVPCEWAGSKSILHQSSLNGRVDKFNIDLERTFVCTEEQLLKYFRKSYVVPKVVEKTGNFKIQDWFQVDSGKYENWISFNSSESGLCLITIEIPRDDLIEGRYPEINYFLSKKRTVEEISHSHFPEDIVSSQQLGNIYVESNCDKWENYRIVYEQGYDNMSADFIKLDEGEYVMYVRVDPIINFRVRFDSQAIISKPEYALFFNKSEIKTIFDSTFYSLSEQYGLEASFKKKSMDESIVLCNTFDELGFGIITVKTLQNAQHDVAMRVYPERLKQKGFDLCSHYYTEENEGKNFVLVSRKGRPEIIVLKRIDKSIKDELDQPFPPPDCIQFFKLTAKKK